MDSPAGKGVRGQWTRSEDVLFRMRFKLDFCLTVYYQLGKVIQMNQLDATMIY